MIKWDIALSTITQYGSNSKELVNRGYIKEFILNPRQPSEVKVQKATPKFCLRGIRRATPSSATEWWMPFRHLSIGRHWLVINFVFHIAFSHRFLIKYCLILVSYVDNQVYRGKVVIKD